MFANEHKLTKYKALCPSNDFPSSSHVGQITRVHRITLPPLFGAPVNADVLKYMEHMCMYVRQVVNFPFPQ